MTNNALVAVIIPCFNEETTIGQTIKEAKKHLPNAKIYVCDNASTDRTADVSKRSGATVVFEPRKGKAHAVRRLISCVLADVYVMIDGDMTYDLSVAPALIHKLQQHRLDMIIGKRIPDVGQKTWRPGHSFGNWLFTTTLRIFFGGNLTDVLSGYRVFSKQFAKSYPILSKGFDIEIEMTTHALATGLSLKEEATSYFERPKGSTSKLSTFRDGWRISKTLFRLLIDFQPLKIAIIGTLLQIGLAIFLFMPIWTEFSASGLVERLPTAILCLGLVITALLTFSCGILLDGISRHTLTLKKLAFLNLHGQGK